jgi:hypothetical protein
MSASVKRALSCGPLTYLRACTSCSCVATALMTWPAPWSYAANANAHCRLCRVLKYHSAIFDQAPGLLIWNDTTAQGTSMVHNPYILHSPEVLVLLLQGPCP